MSRGEQSSEKDGGTRQILKRSSKRYQDPALRVFDICSEMQSVSK